MIVEKLERILSNLQDWQANSEGYIITIASEFEDDLLRLNKEQLNQGIKSDGEEIYPPYTPFTVSVKRANNQPFDRVTLKDTGAFQRSFFGDFSGGEIKVKATDRKTTELVDKYTLQIFGLTEENLTIFAQIILPKVQEEFREFIFS